MADGGRANPSSFESFSSSLCCAYARRCRERKSGGALTFRRTLLGARQVWGRRTPRARLELCPLLVCCVPRLHSSCHLLLGGWRAQRASRKGGLVSASTPAAATCGAAHPPRCAAPHLQLLGRFGRVPRQGAHLLVVQRALRRRGVELRLLAQLVLVLDLPAAARQGSRVGRRQRVRRKEVNARVAGGSSPGWGRAQRAGRGA